VGGRSDRKGPQERRAAPAGAQRSGAAGAAATACRLTLRAYQGAPTTPRAQGDAYKRRRRDAGAPGRIRGAKRPDKHHAIVTERPGRAMRGPVEPVPKRQA